MKQIRFFFPTILLSVGVGITISFSQSALPGSSSIRVYEASTPCDNVSKNILKISSDAKCEFMKWRLTLEQDSKMFSPTTFNVACEYGLAKQGTKGFMEGSKTIELKGKWTIRHGTDENPKAIIYTLHADNPVISLSFLQADPNVLHLFDEENHLMLGNAAWSYTLNRVDPVTVTEDKFVPQAASTVYLAADSATVGIFEGRTPCSNALREINGIPAEGCQLIKCQLTLYQDVITHTPTTFQLHTIYVGKGNTKYTSTGKWLVTKGTRYDPEATVYQLQPDSGKPQEPMELLKADDNILFFLDKDRNYMIGNSYCAYTLNRAKK